jgi:hypothetical protein
MALTQERKGQIALALVKSRFQDEGIRLKPDLKRDIGNQAKKIGVSTDELLQFVEELTREMVEQIFPPRSHTTTNPDHNREM